MMTKHLIKLYQSYSSHFEAFGKKFPTDSLSGPFLISPANTSYISQKRRLFVVGSEIRGSGSNCENILHGMEKYERLHKEKDRHNSAFWEIIGKLERNLKIEAGGSAFTGISKFTLNISALNVIYQKEIMSFDEIILGEIIRIKPEIVVFITGCENDARLKKVFGGLIFNTVKGFNHNEVCSLHHVFLPTNSFRICQIEDLIHDNLDDRITECIANSAN